MADIDYISLLHDQLWTILEGRPAFAAAVKLANRIKLTSAAIKRGQFAAEFPQVAIDLANTSEAVFTAGDEHYGYSAQTVAAEQVWLESSDLTMKIEVIFDNVILDSANSLINEIKSALRSAGPQLGLQWVMRWGPIRRGDSLGSANRAGPLSISAESGLVRRICALLIPVHVEVQGNQQL